MSVAMGADPVLINIKQKSTATANDYLVVLGFRPAAVFFWKCDASANMEDGVVIDGAVDSDADTPHAGALRNNAAASVNELADLGSDGITIHEDGFTFGQDATFMADGARLVFLAFRTNTPVEEFDLSEVDGYEAGYGDGTQFTQYAPSYGPVNVYEV